MNSKKTPPTILLVVATYNCAATLDRCIDSFIKQTYKHKKLVIIDGGSTDGTVDIIKQHDTHISYWVSEPDRGIYDAWNKALTCGVDGDWIQFMGADDYYENDKVLEYVACMAIELEDLYPIIYAKTKCIYPDGLVELMGRPWDGESMADKVGFPGGQVSFFFCRDLFEKYGLFDPEYKIAGDLEHFLRMRDKERGFFLDSVISTVHVIGGISTNPAYDLLHFIERDKALKTHGYLFHKTLAYRYIYLIRYIKYGLCCLLGAKKLFTLVNLFRNLTGGKKITICLKAGKDA